MKTKILFSIVALVCSAAVSGSEAIAGETSKIAIYAQDPNITLPENEFKDFKKLEAATTPDARIKAASDFFKKYPASKARREIAALVVASIAGIPDEAQRLPVYESLLTTFADPSLVTSFYPPLIEAHLKAKRFDDAFRIGALWLGTSPDEVSARTHLAIVAVEEAQKKNPKFVIAGQKYGQEAIALMEANKRPLDMDEPAWGQFKTKWLPQLHQALALVAYSGGNIAETKTHIDKALALGTTDPLAYVLMADMADKEYEALATKYKSMGGGPDQSALLKTVLEQLDKVIDLYAHAVALTDGKANLQPLRDQLMQPLTSYYTYRKGSTEGLQQLIDKYKKPSAAP